tara:strand:+ start:213 stop:389 length:177 start_codon:yes stop_codon:yes gene_type:complete
MEKEYQTKDLKAATTKKEGEIYKDGNVFKFNWKGSQCGFATKKDAEEGLKKVSGKSKN